MQFGKAYKRLEQAREAFVEDLEGLQGVLQRLKRHCWSSIREPSKREPSKKELQGRVHEVAGCAAWHAGAGEPASQEAGL